MDRVQGDDLPAPVHFDSGIGIASGQHRPDHEFAPLESGHLGIELIVQDAKQRIGHGLFAVAIIGQLIKVQRHGGEVVADHRYASLRSGKAGCPRRVDKG